MYVAGELQIERDITVDHWLVFKQNGEGVLLSCDESLSGINV